MASTKFYKYLFVAIVATLFVLPINNLAAEESLIKRNQWERLKDGHQYSEKIPKQKAQKKMELKKSNQRQGFSFNIDGFLKVVSYAAIILLLLAAVYFVIRKMELFDKVNFKKEAVYFEERTTALPQESQLQLRLNAALLANDLRLAVRMLYALMLIKMHQKQWVAFSEEKTPGDYVRELSDTEVKKAFGQFVQVYERTWFGNYPMSEISWGSCFLIYQKTADK